jgi:hypothetical protein
VSACDAQGNIATGYTGTVHFTSSDAQAALPANYTFLVGDAGVHSFASGVTLKTAGSQSVTGTDTVTDTITGPLTVTVNVGAASKLSKNAGDNQVAPPSAAVPIAPSVLVTDAYNNPVSGVGVTFAVASGGGSATGTSATTDTSGIATVGSWTLGPSGGANTLTATSGSLSGSPATFNATGLTIGTPYGGGKVAYILQPVDSGYVAGQVHGLIAAIADQGTGIAWALPAFQYTASGATGLGIGTGMADTTAIINQNGAGIAYAAGLARAYNGGGFNDWYLPSRDELARLYVSKAVIGGFGSSSYLTSSEGDAFAAWSQRFLDGAQTDYYKDSLTGAVRAVRSF